MSKTAIRIISQMPLLVIEGIAKDLKSLFDERQVFEDPDEEMRKRMLQLLRAKPVLKSPARLYIRILCEMTCTQGEPVTDEDICKLIEDALICVKSLTKIFDDANKEAAKKPKINRRHFRHIIRNGVLPKETLNNRKKLVRFATRAFHGAGRN